MKNVESDLSKCAICGSQLVHKKIEFIDRNNGHFLIVRDVPVQECLENGHQFLDAAVAKKIEKLFQLDRQQALTPKEVISVPVVELDMA
jgi:YgiT-type zinc finger domain-containing protein